jgi:hypothetical protein
MTFVTTVLTPDEWRRGAHEGADRQIRRRLAGHQDAHGFNGDGFEKHIWGACGEAAFAKAFGLPWTGAGVDIAQDSDVAFLQVRTRSHHDYELIVWPNDPLNAIYVLVTGTGPGYRVHGWICGRDAKQPKYWRRVTDRPASYFVPQRDLQQFPDLPHGGLAAWLAVMEALTR